MLTILVLTLLLGAYGAWEYASHLSHLQGIRVRIHVNGTRGKSSVTRLIAAGLRAGSSRVMAKTTGTLPRVILEDGREIPIHRVGSANILEQLMVVRLAWERQVEILVVECMAVQPALQQVAETRMIRSSVGVITNARADHLDQMGPTVEDVAEALSNTIPQKGTLFTADQDWLGVFRRRAEAQGSTVVLSSASRVGRRELSRFSYLEHAENVALALKVCEHFGVKRRLALQSMWKATPDPGVLRAYKIRHFGKTLTFYNAFAANDRDSTLKIYRQLRERHAGIPCLVIVNNRGDRLQRAEQFGEMIANDMDADGFFLVGDFTRATQDIALRRGLSPQRLVNLGSPSLEKLFEALLDRGGKRCLVLGVGNIGGHGEEIAAFFKNREKP